MSQAAEERTYGEVRTPVEQKYDALVLARVKLGIALLEKLHGPDWVDQVDLGMLDLSNGSTCVLGQIYGEFTDGITEIWEDRLDTSEAMFAMAEAHGFFESDEDYGPLQHAWDDMLVPSVKKEAVA